jgi:hypothetical protein
MEAGSDTTASTLLSYILGILSNRSALKKAQDEVDAICGTSRSPTFDDLGEMPYLRASMTEVSHNRSDEGRSARFDPLSRPCDGGQSLQVVFLIRSPKMTHTKDIYCQKAPWCLPMRGPSIGTRASTRSQRVSSPSGSSTMNLGLVTRTSLKTTEEPPTVSARGVGSVLVSISRRILWYVSIFLSESPG